MISLTGTVNAWKALPRFIKMIGYVGVVCGTVASAATAYPIMEPYWLAHRGYVRNYDTGQYAPILKRIITVQLVQDRERRQQLLDEAAKRSIELQSDLAKQAPQYHDLVQQRVNRISEELKTLDEQDNSLFKEQKALGGK